MLIFPRKKRNKKKIAQRNEKNHVWRNTKEGKTDLAVWDEPIIRIHFPIQTRLKDKITDKPIWTYQPKLRQKSRSWPQPPTPLEQWRQKPLAKSSALIFIKIGFHPNYVCFSIPWKIKELTSASFPFFQPLTNCWEYSCLMVLGREKGNHLSEEQRKAIF